MKQAIVKVTVYVELDIDTDSPVQSIEQGVVDKVRAAVSDSLNIALDNEKLDISSLGHYVNKIDEVTAQFQPSRHCMETGR